MPSLHYQRKLRKQQRRSRKKIKRQIQGYLLLSAFIVSVLISLYNYASTVDDINRIQNANSRQLMSVADGYYINSLNEFPPLWFSLEQVRNGAWTLNFFGMFYCFLGIAIICDDYFVPAIEVIVERLQMSEDTAGATWMAAGGSAPELFTSFVGTFLAKSDVGFGTIVGSAVFNVLFIIGACAIFTSGELQLQWWPFARDMSFYLICLGVLCLFFGGISKNQMYWWESLVLLSMYFMYVFLMIRNESIKKWFFNTFVYGEDEEKLLAQQEQQKTAYGTEISMQSKQNQTTPWSKAYDPYNGGGANGIHPVSEVFEVRQIKVIPNGRVSNGGTTDHSLNSIAMDDSDEDIDGKHDTAGETMEDSEGISLQFPDTLLARIWYIAKMPLTYPIYFTLMDVSREENEDWWPWTFVGSLLWLGGLSYLMVWWAVVVGYAWRVPQEVMGLVFLAAGTSVPELFSCIIVAKKGQADMAVSASIGSNIFDVLVGLPLPWLAYSIMFNEEAGDLKIDVHAHGLLLSIIVLIIMLSSLFVIILVNKWTLTHCMGYSMMALYVLFVLQDLFRHYFWDVEF